MRSLPLTPVLAAVALLGAAAPAARAAAPDHHAAHAAGPRLQRILDQAVAAPDAPSPGVSLYVRAPGHRVWSGAAGLGRLRPARPMRPDDRFRAGSITKPFVAAATLQLTEEGRLRLDQPISAVLGPRVLARFPGADRITVRMLLNHTSGIADYDDGAFDLEVAADPQRRWSVGELLDRASALPRVFAPGDGFAYSNTDYNLLGLILEHVTGRPWRAVVRTGVIERLHLRHTSLPAPGTVVRGGDIAHGYDVFGGALRDLTDVDSSMAGAAGGNALLTNAGDLTRFVHGLFAGRLFRHRRTLDEMRTFLTTPEEHGRDGYGLGLERYSLPGGVRLIGHMGTGAGYRALMFHLPARHLDFTLALNRPGDPTPVLLPVLQVLLGR